MVSVGKSDLISWNLKLFWINGAVSRFGGGGGVPLKTATLDELSLSLASFLAFALAFIHSI